MADEIIFHEVASFAKLLSKVQKKLCDVIKKTKGPSAIMLSGGSTPLPVYEILAGRKLKMHADMHFLLSDERMVPADSPDNNFHNIAPLITKAGCPEENIFRVKTEKSLVMAAADYGQQLEDFKSSGGKFPFGLLGLGTDGHTASLFTIEDAQSETNYFAIPVERIGDWDRVSVTSTMLQHVEHIVFLVAGEDKLEMLDRLRNIPDTLPAGVAVKNTPRVEVWYSKQGAK